jgi:hypothetical protein
MGGRKRREETRIGTAMPLIDLTYPENALSNSGVHRLSQTTLSRSRFLSPTHLVRSRPNITNEELMNCRAPKIVAGLLLIASADFAIAQQDRFPQPTSLRLSERNLPPGHSWLEIIKRPTGGLRRRLY